MRRMQLVVIGLSLLQVVLCGRIYGVKSPEKMLYQFGGNSDGGGPYTGVTFDASGNIYGATNSYGADGVGVVFQMTPTDNGWLYNVIYTFQKSGGDGQYPYGNLVFDTSNNLYGATTNGGAFGQGAVYKLSSAGGGEWSESIVYSFGGAGGDGEGPASGVVLDASGRLYGTTERGGLVSSQCPTGCGIVFRLTPSPSGQWTESVLYAFQGGNDGVQPSGIVLDSAGNLYGSTLSGGGSGCKSNPYLGCGTIFELSPSEGGNWTESVLYPFQGKRDGAYPNSGVILDSGGNLYGTAEFGGAYGLANCAGSGPGCGVVFELSPNGQGGWTYTSLHMFRGTVNGNKDGARPFAGLVFDNAGRLYGTTAVGGVGTYGFGTVFRLTPGQNGKWSEERYSFPAQSDGYFPAAGVTLDSSGNVYGTTSGGGQRGFGLVFELIPPN